VIDNVRRHAREHGNSVALQQGLLTSPPATPGAELVTRYLPASTENEVGGDWYDAFLQSDGTPVIVIGDVVGHDILAAAAMGQLRGVIRTIGYVRQSTPADILTRTDSTARGLGVAVLASAFLARLVIRPDGATLQWSNAGHPPPLLIRRDGSVRTIAATPEPILGIPLPIERHEHAVELSPGDVLLLYTDGLIERADEDIDDSIAQLAERLRHAQHLPLDQLCDVVLSGHSGGRRDDIALLAMRFLGADATS
jgi:serine phosphatase RsbU (regulator of sigma subunit)